MAYIVSPDPQARWLRPVGLSINDDLAREWLETVHPDSSKSKRKKRREVPPYVTALLEQSVTDQIRPVERDASEPFNANHLHLVELVAYLYSSLADFRGKETDERENAKRLFDEVIKVGK